MSPRGAHRGRVVPLGPEEAWSLLPRSGLGRLVYTKSGLPAVRLLPFVLQGRAMVLALDVVTYEHMLHVIGSVAAVEVDDPQRGWIVTVTSEIRESTAVCAAGFVEDPNLSRWLDGLPTTYIRIESTLVTGQRYLPDGSG